MRGTHRGSVVKRAPKRLEAASHSSIVIVAASAEALEGKTIDWMEQVTDDQYGK
jgi:hypothetical protein